MYENFLVSALHFPYLSFHICNVVLLQLKEKLIQSDSHKTVKEDRSLPLSSLESSWCRTSRLPTVKTSSLYSTSALPQFYCFHFTQILHSCSKTCLELSISIIALQQSLKWLSVVSVGLLVWPWHWTQPNFSSNADGYCLLIYMGFVTLSHLCKQKYVCVYIY